MRRQEVEANIGESVERLQDMADRLTGGDLGQQAGMEDMVQAAADKAEELRNRAAELDGSGPANVNVRVQEDDAVVNFTAPCGSRNSAVADILNTFWLVKQEAEAEAKPEAEAPVEADLM